MSRERKKKLVSSQESLKFSKSLEIAQRNLRETKNIETNEQRQERLLNELYHSESGGSMDSIDSRSSYTDSRKVVSVNHSKGRVTPTNQTPTNHSQGQVPVSHISTNHHQGHISPANHSQVLLNAPAKPPRTMLHTIDDTASEYDNVSERSVDTKVTPYGNKVHASSSSSVTKSMPNTSTPVSYTQKVNGGTKSSHVTFSPAVTEIVESPILAGDASVVKGKKVPPPPPPRRGSHRSQNQSPSPAGSPTKRMPSPSPIYENMESVNGSPKTAPNVTQKGKRMNKFQQEIAAGIYANLNRPDLQEQKVNPVKVVRDCGSPQSDISSDASSSVDSQQGATIKRSPKTIASGSQIPQPKTAYKNGNHKAEQVNGKSKITVKSKKTPPPPPARKTSKLSQGEAEKSVNMEEQYEKLQQLQREIKKEIGQNPKHMPNGHGGRSKNGKKAALNGGETDIY